MNVARIIDARAEPVAVVVEEVAAVIFGGGTVIFPTDTVYGIGCDPYDSGAIDRIYGAKNRPDHKPLTLHVANVREFVEYAPGNARAVQAGRRLMPGPVTLIVRRPTFIDEDVTSGLPTLGFRVPDDQLCMAILERCGPLAATSANTSGLRPYFGAGDWEQLPPADLLVENGLTRWQLESTVIDFAGPHPRLLREGVVGYERLTELIGPVERHAIKVRNTR
ncbi:MAG: L-threonylcarbamoyladenylate synthase [Candidatus Eremiobacteraeota bacterium]|nr:L-threonylcarbamoyladenylate synthase [Candidatus Eremiobacteraeota bacterium]